MISTEEWNGRIDAFIREENEKAGRVVPVRRIFCQDDTDRSGGGIYNETVTIDTIGRFARALGDSNPLFSDLRYQPGQGAAGLFQAPPLLECCICSTFIGGRMPRLRGISVFDAGTKWERFLPIMPGDSFHAQTTFLGVREITKRTEGTDPAARLLIREHRIDLMNQRDEHVSSLTARSVIKCASPLQEDGEMSDRDHAEGRQGCADSRLRPADGRFDCANGRDKKTESQKGRPHYTEEELEGLYANLDAQLAGCCGNKSFVCNTFKLDLALGGCVHAGEDLDQGGFTCTVTADNTMYLAGIQIEIDFIQSNHTREGFCNITQPQQNFFTHGCSSFQGIRNHS